MSTPKEFSGMKQQNLIASWKNSQVTKNEKTGAVTGAFLTVEKDHTCQPTKEDGSKNTNPYIESHLSQNNGKKTTSHTVWYAQSQIDAMKKAGQTCEQQLWPKSENDPNNPITAIAFKADIGRVKNEKTGESRIIVLTPKDPEKAKTDAERDKIKKYNEKHTIGQSDNKKFDSNSLNAQRNTTAFAKEQRDAAAAYAKRYPEGKPLEQPEPDWVYEERRLAQDADDFDAPLKPDLKTATHHTIAIVETPGFNDYEAFERGINECRAQKNSDLIELTFVKDPHDEQHTMWDLAMEYIDRNGFDNISVEERPFKDDVDKIPFDTLHTSDYELLENADQLLAFGNGKSDRIYDILVQAKQTNIPSHMVTDWAFIKDGQDRHMLPHDMEDMLAKYEAEEARTQDDFTDYPHFD